MITLFATPKPFIDPLISSVQRNALRSWTLLVPRPQIILLGDDLGVAEAAHEVGAEHVPAIETSELGTPRLDHLFTQAKSRARNEVMCYINADIILTSDFPRAIAQMAGFGSPFLMSGGRWGLKIDHDLEFAAGWEGKLRDRLDMEGQFAFMGNDYFVFTRDLYDDIPPLAVGRGYFDAWLFSYPRAVGASVIDASSAITAIHQDHDYRHIASGVDPWLSPEGLRNLELVGSSRHWYLREATHELTDRGLKRVRGRKLRYLIKGFFIYRLGPLRQRLGIRRASLARARAALDFRNRPRSGAETREKTRDD